MTHAHHWRTTGKVFALVCECGLAYHDWLLLEISQLKDAASTAVPPEDLAALRRKLEESQEEGLALLAELEDVRGQRAALRTELDEVRRKLETQAEEITAALAGA